MSKGLAKDSFLAVEKLRRQAGRLRTLIQRPHGREIDNLVVQFSLQLVSIATEIDEGVDVLVDHLPEEVKKKDFRRG